MKKIITLLALIAVVSACSMQKYTIQSWMVDFSEYSRQGFMVSTTNINQPYESVALVFSECKNGVDGQREKITADPLYTSLPVPGNYRRCTAAELVAELVTQSKTMGANAVINLKILENDNGLFAEALAIKLK